jgi:hypothetical protein
MSTAKARRAEDRPMVVADRSTTGLYALDWEAP